MIKDIDKFVSKMTKTAMDVFANQNNLRSNKLGTLTTQKIKYSNELQTTPKVPQELNAQLLATFSLSSPFSVV